MSNTKHTPGPWIKHNGGVYSAKAKDGKFYAEMSVAACHTDEDARLIAAAPELLSIAKSVAAKGFHRVPNREGECLCSMCELVREARAAIAKAEGV